MSDKQTHWIKINRAPVLTLWAAVVAAQLGFRQAEALTLGKAVAGLNAYSKGKSLGIFKPCKKKLSDSRKRMRKGESFRIELLGRAVPARREADGIRAVKSGKPISPDSVEKYLRSKFGDALGDTRDAMGALARAHTASQLRGHGYALYKEFRPSIPSGKKGWGAEGRLSLDKIRRLAADAKKT